MTGNELLPVYSS